MKYELVTQGKKCGFGEIKIGEFFNSDVLSKECKPSLKVDTGLAFNLYYHTLDEYDADDIVAPLEQTESLKLAPKK